MGVASRQWSQEQLLTDLTAPMQFHLRLTKHQLCRYRLRSWSDWIQAWVFHLTHCKQITLITWIQLLLLKRHCQLSTWFCIIIYYTPPSSWGEGKATNGFATEGEVLFKNWAVQGSDINTTRQRSHGKYSNRWKIVTVLCYIFSPVLRLQTLTYISPKYELLGCKEMKGLQVHCLYFLMLNAVFYVASLEEGDSISTLGE